jgi:hypothetical protein
LGKMRAGNPSFKRLLPRHPPGAAGGAACPAARHIWPARPKRAGGQARTPSRSDGYQHAVAIAPWQPWKKKARAHTFASIKHPSGALPRNGIGRVAGKVCSARPEPSFPFAAAAGRTWGSARHRSAGDWLSRMTVAVPDTKFPGLRPHRSPPREGERAWRRTNCSRRGWRGQSPGGRLSAPLSRPASIPLGFGFALAGQHFFTWSHRFSPKGNLREVRSQGLLSLLCAWLGGPEPAIRGGAGVAPLPRFVGVVIGSIRLRNPCGAGAARGRGTGANAVGSVAEALCQPEPAPAESYQRLRLLATGFFAWQRGRWCRRPARQRRESRLGKGATSRD